MYAAEVPPRPGLVTEQSLQAWCKLTYGLAGNCGCSARGLGTRMASRHCSHQLVETREAAQAWGDLEDGARAALAAAAVLVPQVEAAAAWEAEIEIEAEAAARCAVSAGRLTGMLQRPSTRMQKQESVLDTTSCWCTR